MADNQPPQHVHIEASNGGRAAMGDINEAAEPCPQCETRLLSQGRTLCRKCEAENDRSMMWGVGFIGLIVWVNLGRWLEGFCTGWWPWAAEHPMQAAAWLIMVLLGVLAGLLMWWHSGTD